MSQHKTQQFTNFTKSRMDAGLSLHRLPTDAPSQLADAFRAGAEWGAQQSQDAKRYRWLREGKSYTVTVPTPTTKKPDGKTTILTSSNTEPAYGEALDAAIDAAMKGQTP